MSELALPLRRLVTTGPLLVVLGLGLALGEGGDFAGYVCAFGFVITIWGLHRLGRAGPNELD